MGVILKAVVVPGDAWGGVFVNWGESWGQPNLEEVRSPALAGDAAFTPSGNSINTQSGQLAGDATFTVSGTALIISSAQLTGAATMTVSGSAFKITSANMSATATVNFDGEQGFVRARPRVEQTRPRADTSLGRKAAGASLSKKRSETELV